MAKQTTKRYENKPEITTENVCATITEKMIELLKTGYIPWKKPWDVIPREIHYPTET